MIFVKSLDLNAGLKIVIIIPLVFLVIYSLARIKPKKPAAEKDTGKYSVCRDLRTLLRNKKHPVLLIGRFHITSGLESIIRMNLRRVG
jgi:hypothetical protein